MKRKRRWPGTQQKRRQDKRRAAAVAERLLGKKKASLFSPAEDIHSMYQHGPNIQVTNPRTNIYLKGIM